MTTGSMGADGVREGSSYEVVSRLLGARHSCRAFRPDPVPRSVIERIVEAAQRTASGCNTQPWHVLIASGRAAEAYRATLLAHVATHAPAPDIPPPVYEGAYRDRRRECGWALYDSVGVRPGDREASARQAAKNYSFFGAPHVAIISSPKALGGSGLLDCGGYVANFVLAAESLGVASVPQASLAAHADLVHDHFAVPYDRCIVCGISFGYEDCSHRANGFRTRREDLAVTVDYRD